jgi:hypothetical protein
MSKCAVVQLSNSMVVNLIVAEPTDSSPDGCELILVPTDVPCDIGWTWDGTQFVPSDAGVSNGN